jgi:hypothetical protein
MVVYSILGIKNTFHLKKNILTNKNEIYLIWDVYGDYYLSYCIINPLPKTSKN